LQDTATEKRFVKSQVVRDPLVLECIGYPLVLGRWNALPKGPQRFRFLP